MAYPYFEEDLTSDSGQPGFLHLLAERDDADELWEMALAREDCPINAMDADGNTPLMKAVAAGRAKLVERCLDDPARIRQIDANVVNGAGDTLLHLCVQVRRKILKILL